VGVEVPARFGYYSWALCVDSLSRRSNVDILPVHPNHPKILGLQNLLRRVIMASAEKIPAAIEAAKNVTNVPWCEDYEKMILGML
jgi:hypothetical protein